MLRFAQSYSHPRHAARLLSICRVTPVISLRYRSSCSLTPYRAAACLSDSFNSAIRNSAGRGSNRQPDSHAASPSCWPSYDRNVHFPSGENISVDGLCRSSTCVAASNCYTLRRILAG